MKTKFVIFTLVFFLFYMDKDSLAQEREGITIIVNGGSFVIKFV